VLLGSRSGTTAYFAGDPIAELSYIRTMQTILPYLLGAAMLATLVVLFAGIIAFAFSPGLNAKYSTKLMSARVILQGVALGLFALMAALHIA
jgi:hypothetical protein